MWGDLIGCSYYPTTKWVKKGTKHVTSDQPDDKRQYTGDIVHNAAGDIIQVLQIWDGKTNASLPPLNVREEYTCKPTCRMTFDLSLNHWANHETKVRLLERTWEWVCAQWTKDGLPGEPRCIYFLDCWPVNLTDRLRDEITTKFPGMRLRFIPAGATGKYQVNDTHLHKPLKDAHRAAAQQWRMGKIMFFRAEYKKTVAAGGDRAAAMATMQRKVALLMSKKVLRAISPSWLWQASQVLLQPRADGRNLVKKGWDQNFLEAAMAPGFVERARENLIERRIAAATAAAFEAGRAAAIQAGATGEGVGSLSSVAQQTSTPTRDTDEEALIQQVAAYERPWHEAEAATLAETGKKRQGRADDRARSRAAKRAATDAAIHADADVSEPHTGDAVAEAPAEAAPPAEELKSLSKPDLVKLCRERGMAYTGNKNQLIERLVTGKKRSNRGRSAAQPNLLADNGSEEDEEELQAQPERFADPSLDSELDDPEAHELAQQVAEEDLAAMQDLGVGYIPGW